MERLVAAHPDRIWLCMDRMSPDHRHSATPVALTGYLHFAPTISLSPLGIGQFRLETERCAWFLRFLRLLNVGDAEVIDGWYCPEFGRRLRAPVLVYSAESQPFGWIISDRPCDCQLGTEVGRSGNRTPEPSQVGRDAISSREVTENHLEISFADEDRRSYRMHLKWDCD